MEARRLFSPAEQDLCALGAGGASWRRAKLAIIIRQEQKLQPYLCDCTLSCFSRADFIQRGKYRLCWPSVWSPSYSTKSIIFYLHTLCCIHNTQRTGGSERQHFLSNSLKGICRPACARECSGPSAIGRYYYGDVSLPLSLGRAVPSQIFFI